ncbi:MAG: hypothetical protein FJ028_06205 [Chloroflexi bacterium]|nr:hypothetical protein [Chloroflexota bacterium]
MRDEGGVTGGARDRVGVAVAAAERAQDAGADLRGHVLARVARRDRALEVEHLPHRPERDALAVRRAPPDERRVLLARDPVLGQPRLPDPRGPEDCDERGPALGADALVRRVEQVELALPADERRARLAEALRLDRSPGTASPMNFSPCRRGR